MQVSFNELEARLKKAAKGSGLCWGIAEEFAKSLVWLAQSDICLDQWVIEFLEDPEASDLLAQFSFLLDLREQPSSRTDLSDHQRWVWLGFAGRLAKLEGVELELNGVIVSPKGLILEPLESTDSAGSLLRAEVADDVWQRLEQLEFQTYAPESELSRIRGAGAGVTDND